MAKTTRAPSSPFTARDLAAFPESERARVLSKLSAKELAELPYVWAFWARR